MSGLSFARQQNGFAPMNVVQVPFGDSRIGDGTDHAIAMTAPYIALLFAGVKHWTVTKSGTTFPDWWNTSPLALPGGAGILPNHNVWTSWNGTQGHGSYLYTSPGTTGNANITTPQITMREQYPFSIVSPRGTDIPMTTGLAGGNAYQFPDVGIDLSSPVYWDTIGYYPKIFVLGGTSFATNKSLLGVSPTVLGQLIIFNYACNIYQTNGFGLTGNLTWNIVDTW